MNVFALGFFELIHQGHIAVLEKTVELAHELNARPCVFSYTIEVGESIRPDRAEHSIFPKTREQKMREHGIENVFMPPFSSIKNLTPVEFLTLLTVEHNAVGFVCGVDYRFGKNAAGNAALLEGFCECQGLRLTVVPTVQINGKKISSREIKNAEKT